MWKTGDNLHVHQWGNGKINDGICILWNLRHLFKRMSLISKYRQRKRAMSCCFLFVFFYRTILCHICIVCHIWKFSILQSKHISPSQTKALPLLSSRRWLKFKVEFWAYIALLPHQVALLALNHHSRLGWNALWNKGTDCQRLEIWGDTALWDETRSMGNERQEVSEQKNSLPCLPAMDYSECGFFLQPFQRSPACQVGTPPKHLHCLCQACGETVASTMTYHITLLCIFFILLPLCPHHHHLQLAFPK